MRQARVHVRVRVRVRVRVSLLHESASSRSSEHVRAHVMRVGARVAFSTCPARR